MTSRRAGFYVLLLAVSGFANSLGNGFAYDDNGVIPQNPVVTSGTLGEALTSPYWPDPIAGGGLYRPVTSLSFALEWRVFGEDPLGFHILNVLVHGVASVLLFLLIVEVGAPVPGALAGAGLFAIHPVHTEAVANVVGRGELYAAVFFFLACLLYLKGKTWRGWARGGRLILLGVLYFLSLGSKEIGVTLPGVLVLLEWFRGKARGSAWPSGRVGGSFTQRLWGEAPTFVLLGVVLLAFLGLRFTVLGVVLGDVPAPVLAGLEPIQRVFTAIQLWPQYLRLLLFPFDLVADYSPGVLFPTTELGPGALLGVFVVLALGLLAYRAHRAAPTVPVGVLWVGITILPVSHLFFSAGVLLAERTLYLPSAGLSFAAVPLVPWIRSLGPKLKRLAVAGMVVVAGAFFVKTVLRNPAWMSTWVVLETLNRDHPESFRAFRARAIGLDHVGEKESAGEAYLTAATLAPNHHGIQVEAGHFFGKEGDWTRGGALLRRAIEIAPDQHNAYRALAGQLLRQERGREAHEVALRGLEVAGPDGDLWGLLSESYILKGDLSAAIRARQAALGQEPDAPHHWRRLADLQAAVGDEAGASSSRMKAEALAAETGSTPEGVS